jgi:hypothetical protein
MLTATATARGDARPRSTRTRRRKQHALLAAALLLLTLALLALPALAVGRPGQYRNFDAKDVTYWDLRGRIPWHDESYDFGYNVGVAHLGVPFIYRFQSEGIFAVPYKLPLPPNTDRPPQRNGAIVKVMDRSAYDHVLGVTEVGAPSPDVWVFYVRDAQPGTVYWRQAREQYKTEHQFVFPRSWHWKDTFQFDSDNQGRFKGKVLTVAGSFAIAYISPDGRRVTAWVNLDLGRTGGPSLTSATTIDLRGSEGMTADERIRSLDVASVRRAGREYLACATVEGVPDTSFTRYKPYGKWATHRITLGFYHHTETWQQDTAMTADISLTGEDNWYHALADDRTMYGTRGVQLVQGSVSGFAKGDVLQIFTQNACAVGGDFCDQFVGRYEYSLDQGRMVQGGDCMYDTTKREEVVDSVDFFSFTQANPNPTFKNGEYVGNDRYIYVATTHAREARTESYHGWVSCFKSDRLIPIESEIIDGEKVDYPTRMDPGDALGDWVLEGVVFGPPPFSLQGWDYSDFQAGAKKGSRTSFKKSTGESSKLTRKVGGSVTATAGFEAFDLGFSSSVSFGMDYESTKSTSTQTDVTFDFRHDQATAADYGYFIYSRPTFEAQAYTRQDWSGTPIPDSRLFVTHCIDKETDSLLVHEPFNMINPDSATYSKGIRKHARCSDFSNVLWRANPLDGANGAWEKISSASFAGDVRGGEQTVSVTKSKETSGSLEAHASLSGKIKGIGGSVKMEVHGSVASESTMSNADNTAVYLGLDAPKQGATGTLAQRIEEDVYWMKADSADAYWIPAMLRTGGNDQTPWCIDYRVRSWTPFPRSGEPGAEESVNAMAVVASPADGGAVGITGADPATPYVLNVPVGSQAVITATPADDYRFVGWKAEGETVTIADPNAAQTTAAAATGGGGTCVAQFERITPSQLVVKQRSPNVCDISMTGAPLAGLFTQQATSDPTTMQLGLRLGDVDLAIPQGSWAATGGKYSSVSSPWGKKSKLALELQPADGTWSLDATGAKAVQFLRECAAGEVELSMSRDGETLGEETLPVSAQAGMDASGVDVGRRVGARVDLSHAHVSVKAPARVSKTRLRVWAIRVSPRILAAHGRLVVDLNGQEISARRFTTRRDGVRVWRGKTLLQYKAMVAYTRDGWLSVELSGGLLRPQLSDVVAQNLTVRVARGGRSGTGNLITAIRTLKGVKPL